MALKNDSFFSLSKSERRATLLLIIILLILTGARIAQYYYHSREKVEVTTEYESFQSELEAVSYTHLQAPVLLKV